MKIDRQKVYEKFDGHCAYCGCELDFKRMQVDHFWPKFLAHHKPDLDNNRFENLMPSCQPCNIHKHGMMPEAWRGELGRQLSMLMGNAQFKRVLRFGLVELTQVPIVFYFETFAQNNIELENRIVRVMCRCGRITEQKDNGHFHEKVDFVRACTCKICSPESAHHQMEYFKRDGSRFYNGIKEE